MTFYIAALVAQDGLASGLLYALLAFSILLVFLVTRVLWVPAGDVMVGAALTMPAIANGQLPGSIWLLLTAGVFAALASLWDCWRTGTWHCSWKPVMAFLAYPLALLALLSAVAGTEIPVYVRVVLTFLIVAPIAPMIYVAVFERISHATVLTKLIVAVAVHIVIVGMLLLFFGAEGARSPAFAPGRVIIGALSVSWQLVLVFVLSLMLMISLGAFFEWSLWGKALRATAVNQLGARLVGIPAGSAGLLAFAIAGAVSAISGILIGPITTLYFDSGFVLGLKGFIAVVFAGMASFPGTILASLGVGLLDAFASFIASSYRDVIVFSALIPALLWRSLTTHVHDDEEEH